MVLEHANAPLHTLGKIVVFWTVNTIVALTGIAVWSSQHLDACARTATLVSLFQINDPHKISTAVKIFTTLFLLDHIDYSGEYCQHLECLNNCSYPNGECNQETGQCSCSTLYNPYDRRQHWGSWQGEDCSYLPAWSGVFNTDAMSLTSGIVVLLLSLSLLFM